MILEFKKPGGFFFLGQPQEIVLKHSPTHLLKRRTVGFNRKMDFYIASDLSSNWGLKKKGKRKEEKRYVTSVIKIHQAQTLALG